MKLKKYAISAVVCASAFVAAPVLAWFWPASTPPAANGTYSQWDPSVAGAQHWTLVDEQPCNNGVDMIGTNTVGEKDSYRVDLSGVPNGLRVNRIGISPCAGKLGEPKIERSTIKTFYKLNGGAEIYGGSVSLMNTGFTQFSSSSFDVDFVKDANTTLEIGVRFIGGAGGAKVSRLGGEVRYSD